MTHTFPSPGILLPRLGRVIGVGVGVLACAGSLPRTIEAASISEPDALLYGRIVNRAGAAEQVITAGTLRWTFQVQGSSPRTFSAELEPIQDGTYSYRLRIPHSLVGTGLQSTSETLPLAIDATPYAFGAITVDGVTAQVDEEDVYAIIANQESRAQALRIDLAISQPMADGDGDGMPDWWEEAHGLDPFSAADAATDLDGDGLSNLAEWNGGHSPRKDNRVPSLAQLTFSVYPKGYSGLPLRVVDTDSAPAGIALVVTRLPVEGALVVRGPDGGKTLERGDFFTAADALAGLVEYRREEVEPLPVHSVTVGVAITDEAAGASSPLTPGWVFDEAFLEGPEGSRPVSQEIQLYFVRDEIHASDETWENLADSATVLPGMADTAALRAKASLYARHHRAVVWDMLDHYRGSTIRAVSGASTAADYAAAGEPRFGTEMPLFLLGGDGNDVLEGGFGPDVLFGGRGTDTLTGHLGPDRFIAGTGGGTPTLEDFNPEEGDQLDLTRVFAGKSGFADAYIRISGAAGGDSVLHVYADATRSGAPEAEVRFAGLALSEGDFPEFARRGVFLLGGLSTTPSLAVEAAEDARENGLKPGRFVIRRSGGLETALALTLQFSGSAAAGVDYQLPGSSLVLAAGKSEAEVWVRPYSDGLSEASESVRLSLSEGPGYRLASGGGAELVIHDLVPEFSITVVRAEASFDPWSPAILRIRREGLIDRQVLLELQWSGSSALGWVDALPLYLDFARGDTAKLVEIRPKAGTTRPAQPLALNVRLTEDSNHLLGEASAARVAVIPSSLDFGKWVATSLPGAGTDLEAVALSDPGDFGMTLLERFAFALAPTRPDHRSSSLPRIVRRHGKYGVEFVLRPGATGLSFSVETLSATTGWGGGSASLVEILPAPGEIRPVGWHRFEARESVASPQRNFRVRLNHTP